MKGTVKYRKIVKMSKKDIFGCPYCGKRLKYREAFLNLRQGEYTCKKCKKYSNIKYSTTVYIYLMITALLSCIFGFILFKSSLLGVILSIVPFIILYLCMPLFLRLAPVKMVKINYNEHQNNRKTGTDIKKNKKYSKYDSSYKNKTRIVKSEETDMKTYIPRSQAIKENIKDDNSGETKYIPDIL